MTNETTAVVASRVPEMVSMGYAAVRAENDNLATVAIQQPRVPEVVLQTALGEFAMLSKAADPAYVEEYAKKGYYSIPYADSEAEGGKTFVEGLSVRSMERLMRLWGNCSVTGRLLNEDERGYDVVGIAIDFQSNWRLERTVRVSKYAYRKKQRGMVLLDERAQTQAVQIGISKATRNAGLAMLPDWLRALYFRRIKELAAGALGKPADPARAEKGIAWFASHGIPLAKLEEKVGKPRAQWTGDDLGNLIGLAQAIRDGEVTIEETFGGAPKAEEKPVVTVEQVQGGAVEAKDDAQRERSADGAVVSGPEPISTPVGDEPGAAEAAALFRDI